MKKIRHKKKEQVAGGIPIKPMYCIEVYLLETNPGSTEHTPSGVMMVWAVNAIGDRAITYMCSKCGHLFPPGYEVLINAETKDEWTSCPSCGLLVPDAMLQTSYGFKTALPKIAAQVAEIYECSNRNASVRLRRYKSKIGFDEAIANVATTKYWDMLAHARSAEAQEWIDYPADHIHRDLLSGQDTTTLFTNFLRA